MGHTSGHFSDGGQMLSLSKLFFQPEPFFGSFFNDLFPMFDHKPQYNEQQSHDTGAGSHDHSLQFKNLLIVMGNVPNDFNDADHLLVHFPGKPHFLDQGGKGDDFGFFGKPEQQLQEIAFLNQFG